MARRKGSRSSKMSPAVTRLWFRIDGYSNYNYVDLSLAASAINRRFYRQGTTWAVSGMSLHTTGATGSVEVSKIPDSWVAKNAHTKAKSMWMKSQAQVLDEQPTVASKYRDFKIYMDEDMIGVQEQDINVPAGNGTLLLPVDRRGYTIKTGEWDYSTIQLPDTGGSNPPTEVTMHMVGDDDLANGSVAIIHGYAESRSRPYRNDPNIPADGGWMNSVLDVADNLDEIREDLSENNNQPPYKVGDVNASTASQQVTFYPNGPNNQPHLALHDKQGISSTTVGGKTHINGGMN